MINPLKSLFYIAEEQRGPLKIKSWLLWGLPLFVVFLFRLPYFGIDNLNSDEGLYSAVARIMQNGGLPYRDAWDHAAPGVYYTFYWMYSLFGSWNMIPVRLTALFAHYLSGMIVFWYLRRKYGDLTGLAGSILTITSIGGYLATDSIACITEIYLLPPFLIGTLLILNWQKHGLLYAPVMGLMIALATWFKIHALFILFIMMLIVFIQKIYRQENIKKAFGCAVGAMVFSAIFYLLFMLPIFVKGGFSAFMQQYIGRNLVYFGVGKYDGIFLYGLMRTAWQWGLPQFLVIGFTVTLFIKLFQSNINQKFKMLFLLLSLGVAVFMGFAGGRLFGHYFLPAAALMGLFAGMGFHYFHEYFKDEINKKSALMWGILIILVAGIFIPISTFHGQIWASRIDAAISGGELRGHFPKLTKVIQEVTKPDEKIWVWGFAPEIYQIAQRDCSTRFIDCNYLVGLVPWVNVDPEIDTTPLIVPGSWDLLHEDLEKDPPVLIVDAAAANYQFWGKYQISGNKALFKFIASNYLDLGSHDDFRVYMRMDSAISKGYYTPPAEDNENSTQPSENN